MLILDASHAGAAGFPSLAETQADLIVGDPEKWLLPPSIEVRVSFGWVRNRAVVPVVKRQLGPFFGSLHSPDRLARLSRWVNSSEVEHVLHSLPPTDRDSTLSRHLRNLTLGRHLALELGTPPPETAIIWLNGRPTDPPDWLADERLVWEVDGGTRIMCRADTVPEGVIDRAAAAHPVGHDLH